MARSRAFRTASNSSSIASPDTRSCSTSRVPLAVSRSRCRRRSEGSVETTPQSAWMVSPPRVSPHETAMLCGGCADLASRWLSGLEQECRHSWQFLGPGGNRSDCLEGEAATARVISWTRRGRQHGRQEAYGCSEGQRIPRRFHVVERRPSDRQRPDLRFSWLCGEQLAFSRSSPAARAWRRRCSDLPIRLSTG